MSKDYFSVLSHLLDTIEREEQGSLHRAAQLLAGVIQQRGIVHIFGSGHSHMIAEEVFHRAGGLVPINAILDPNLTAFGTLSAGVLERTEGYATALLTSFDVRPGEALVVVSTSGINPVPVEMAIEAQACGVTVIALTSAANYRDIPSRHSSGRKLVDLADVVIDNHVPLGDAALDLPANQIRVGPTSTVLGAALINALIVETAHLLARAGHDVPVLTSMNIPGGAERNRDLLDRYRTRLRLLKG